METQEVELCASQTRLGQGELMEMSQTQQIHVLCSSWVPDMAHIHKVVHTIPPLRLGLANL
jgi:hypothetical protein